MHTLVNPITQTFSAQKIIAGWLLAVSAALVVTMTTDLTVLTAPLEEGSVTSVPFMDVAGLRAIPSVSYFCRGETVELWNKLDSSSHLVNGPPGSGKSTSVWFWLLRRVMKTGERAMWCHFSELGTKTCVLVSRSESSGTGIQFAVIEDDDPFEAMSGNVDFCVVDGVREENRKEAGKSWKLFSRNQDRRCRMYWVSCQQVVVPQQELELHSMEEYSYYSWTEGEVCAFAQSLSPEAKEEFRVDVANTRAIQHRLEPEAITFTDAVNIKLWFCGTSARWVFGMTMEKALKDLSKYVSKVNNAQVLYNALQGNRGNLYVNHVIAHYESTRPGRFDGELAIASSFMVELLAKQVGIQAIVAMYRSPWVRDNPVVHGFVFEWDIITQIEKDRKLSLVDDQNLGITWTVDEDVPLATFLRDGITADRMLVRPEKWNQPDFDGLYIFQDEHGEKQLIAWNASEAADHKGNVSKLVTMLEELSQRETNAINFNGVRFVFIVPAEQRNGFRLSISDSDNLLAKQQLHAWSFPGFELLAAFPSSS